MTLLIKNGHVVDPANGIDEKMDIFVERGKIAALGRKLKTEAAKVIDASGLIVTPGWIDMHVHLRQPGYEYKETIATGTASAAAGGFTSVACMANTKPVNDSEAVTKQILELAQLEGSANVFPIAAVTKGLAGKELAELAGLKSAGAVAFSDDGRPVEDAGVMRRALEYASMLSTPVIQHAETTALAAGGGMNEGAVSTRLGLKGQPAIAEETMAVRDISIAEFVNAQVHIAHVSSGGTVRAVRDGKKRGVRVTCETAPHYFALTDSAVEQYDTHAKMNPPLRTKPDIKEIKKGLADGTIDAIATDHAPHAVHEKDLEFESAMFGIVGLETALPLCLGLVRDEVLDMPSLIAKVTVNPARILGIPKGTLSEGADADITVIDPGMEWVVDSSQFKSKGRNTPFNGWKMTGRAVYTILRGKVVHSLSGVQQ